MKRFRNILVLAHGSDGGVAAIDQAATLASHASAKVTIVDYVAELSKYADVGGIPSAELHKQLVAAKQSELEKLAERLREQGIQVQYELLQGNGAEKVVDYVLRHGHDLLIKSAEQPRGLAQRLFGTVGQRLMRKCPCPVWIIRAPAKSTAFSHLDRVDPMPVEKERNPMNVKMMELATSLATLHGSDLHVAYVWPYWAQCNPSMLAPQQNADLRQINSQIEAAQKARLEELIGPFRKTGPDFTTHLLQGEPGNMIASLTADLDVSLLVLGTIGKLKLNFFQIGHTAEKILDQVHCSVLTVKPDRFAEIALPRIGTSGAGIAFA